MTRMSSQEWATDRLRELNAKAKAGTDSTRSASQAVTTFGLRFVDRHPREFPRILIRSC